MPPSAHPVLLDGRSLVPGELEGVASGGRPVEASKEGRHRLRRARGVIESILKEGRTVYGVNTGFGKFSNVAISEPELERLQINLVRSHAVGVGDDLPGEVVRAMMVLKANELLHGHSGAREEVLDQLLSALNRGLVPRVPKRGSVGASGDLAPLAHIALCLTGEGEALEDGAPVPAAQALQKREMQPLRLRAKDGLSLVNGTQLTTALLALAVTETERLVRTADVIAAMTLDSLLGSVVPADPRIQAARAHAGQAASAANLRRLLQGSELIQSHADCDRVQDAYSLRCTPQVHGAAREALAYARRIVEVELNACTDNPLVFPAEGEGSDDVLSGGNFHAQIPAHAADSLTLGLTQIAGISERRMERLVNPSLNEGLPAFLVADGGLNSGLMMVQVTAAALVSECRTLSNPASSQSISTSADQEDFVSMGPVAGRKLREVLGCVSSVLGLELVAACQALDLRQPVESSPVLESVHERLRQDVATLDQDRFLAPDLEVATRLVRSGEILRAVEEGLGEPLV